MRCHCPSQKSIGKLDCNGGMVHRLGLAYKDALKECMLYMLGNLFAFYKHYLPRASLRTAFQTLQETPGKTVKFKFCH